MLHKRIDKAWAIGICIAICAAFVSIGIVQADITNPGGSSSSGGGGADGNWVFYNGSGLRMTTTTNSVLMGGSATSTNDKLQVIGNTYVSGTSAFGTTTQAVGSEMTIAAGSNPVGFVLDSTSATGLYTIYRNSSTDFGYVGSASVLFSGSLSDFGFRSANNIVMGIGTSEKMRVASTGNVGIATTSPYSKLSVAGQVVGQNFVATTTTATSSFAGNVLVGTDTSFGFNAGQPLVIVQSLDGAAQMNFINKSAGTNALAGFFLGNGKTTNAGYFSQYYAGLAYGGQNVNVAGFSQLTPDTLALVNSNGDVKIGSNSANAASSSVKFYTQLGFNTIADLTLDFYGNVGIGNFPTSGINSRLHVVSQSNATTSALRVDTGTGSATTTNLLVQQNGYVGIGTTTATSTLDVYGSFGGRVTLITSTTTIDNTYYTVRADTTSNAVGVNLPQVSGVCGRHYYIVKKNSGPNAITVDPFGSELIAGTTTQAITTQHGALHIQAACDDSSWLILN